jgi:hypothetical protein
MKNFENPLELIYNNMKKRKRYLIGLLVIINIIIICCVGKERPVSLKSLTPVVIKKNGAEIFQYWEFTNYPELWDTNFLEPSHLKLYKDSLNNLLGNDTVKLTVQKLALQDVFYKSVNTQNGDSINAQLIHSKILGKIRPINYLEAQLIDYQLSRYPLLSHPTEFHGFILLQDSLNIVRVYFAASDQPWPPKPNVILEDLKTDLKNGWTFKQHLHNHYEPKANLYLGILAPSMTDAQYYLFLSEEYNLKQAIITNGYHTVEIQKEDFQKLKSPEDN